MRICTHIKILEISERNVVTSAQLMDISLVPDNHEFGVAGDDVHLPGLMTALDSLPRGRKNGS